MRIEFNYHGGSWLLGCITVAVIMGHLQWPWLLLGFAGLFSFPGAFRRTWDWAKTRLSWSGK